MASERMVSFAAGVVLDVDPPGMASGPAEPSEVVQRFGELCERAAPGGVVVVLEFLPIFTIGTLAAALDVGTEVDQPNGAVLVDTLLLAAS